jgi:hypothetical protein
MFHIEIVCKICRVYFCITFTEFFSRDAVKILAEGAPSSLNYDVILKELYQVSTYGHHPAIIMRLSNLNFDRKKFCIYFTLLLPIFSFSFTHSFFFFFSLSFFFCYIFPLFLFPFSYFPPKQHRLIFPREDFLIIDP